MMKASYLGAMGYSQRYTFPTTWPIPPSYHDPETSVESYQEGMEECELAEAVGFDWISFSEHHYSGRIATGAPAVMAAAVAERCKNAKIAMLGHLLTLNNPVRVAEELGLLDNLTNGRLVIGFLRGTPNEDQTYSINPSEGRERLLEGMDLVIKALTELQPFSWEGRYYQFRTVAVWPRPVQQPLPPMVVATRGDDMLQYAATHKLGLAVSFVPIEQMAQVVEKYIGWCREAGWQPTPDQIIYRGNIYLAETDQQADAWFEGVKGAGPAPGGIAMRPTQSRAVQAARAGEAFDLRNVLAGSAQGDVVGVARSLNFIGGPDTVAKQIKAFHDQCGVGVVDLFFQQPSVSHKEVMKEIELFGKEVLPQIKAF
ncbi:LLM class flavin-dependent oxidoreductase [Candidatus Entotheonella palauensis]|uniref:LLM class flavin-dependent oxidoreductase n=1 Tax=Candidatus Entotheonella palauensis TaxID=93172 RepID=UPI000B7CD72D|nr:LLM class flavin-dependent oxidoreductase [Candidatus Entotheonella palauensis]